MLQHQVQDTSWGHFWDNLHWKNPVAPPLLCCTRGIHWHFDGECSLLLEHVLLREGGSWFGPHCVDDHVRCARQVLHMELANAAQVVHVAAVGA